MHHKILTIHITDVRNPEKGENNRFLMQFSSVYTNLKILILKLPLILILKMPLTWFVFINATHVLLLESSRDGNAMNVTNTEY